MNDESKSEGGQRGGEERRSAALHEDGPQKTLQFYMASGRHGYYDGTEFSCLIFACNVSLKVAVATLF